MLGGEQSEEKGIGADVNLAAFKLYSVNGKLILPVIAQSVQVSHRMSQIVFKDRKCFDETIFAACIFLGATHSTWW